MSDTGSPGITREQAYTDYPMTPDTQPPDPQRPEGQPPAQQWKPPQDKQEYVVEENFREAPEWIDKGWVGMQGLKVPKGDYPFDSPYTTELAVPGDTVQFVPPSPVQGGHFIVVKNTDPELMRGVPKPAQESAASLEDLLKMGHLKADELPPGWKTALLQRSPKLSHLLTGEVPPPEAPKLTVKAASIDVG